MFLLFSRVNNLVLEWRALEDGSRSADDASLLRMEVRSQCSMIQHDLEDDSIWLGRWSASERKCSPKPGPSFTATANMATARIAAGLEFYRAALRIMIMRDVVGLPASHPRVERCVDALLNAIPRIRTGTEIGLVWPWLVSPRPAVPSAMLMADRSVRDAAVTTRADARVHPPMSVEGLGATTNRRRRGARRVGCAGGWGQDGLAGCDDLARIAVCHLARGRGKISWVAGLAYGDRLVDERLYSAQFVVHITMLVGNGL